MLGIILSRSAEYQYKTVRFCFAVTRIRATGLARSNRWPPFVYFVAGGQTLVVLVLNLSSGGFGLGSHKSTFWSDFPSLANHFPSLRNVFQILRRDESTLEKLFSSFRQAFPSMENDGSRLGKLFPSWANSFPNLGSAGQTLGNVLPSLDHVSARLPGSFSTLNQVVSRLGNHSGSLSCFEPKNRD